MLHALVAQQIGPPLPCLVGGGHGAPALTPVWTFSPGCPPLPGLLGVAPALRLVFTCTMQSPLFARGSTGPLSRGQRRLV